MNQPKLKLVWSAVNLLAQQGRRKKQRNNQEVVVRWSQSIPGIAACIAVLGVILGGCFYFDERMARLEQNFSNLSKRLDDAEVFKSEYRKAAIEKGFKDPAIVPVKLVYQDTPIKHPPIADTKGRVANIDYDVTYELFKLSEGKMHFRVNGHIGNNKFEDNIVPVPLVFDRPVDMTFVNAPSLPRFYVQVIARPTTNSAILAIGPRGTDSKTS
ncbi:MAG TPA: hypothetical protein VI585_12190 [Candidatus Binatia bacterium]